MPEIKLQHVISCSSEDSVSVPFRSRLYITLAVYGWFIIIDLDVYSYMI